MKNIQLIMCLSFLPKIAIDPVHIPLEVRKILKNRIEMQYEKQFANRDVQFDDTKCTDQGTYEFKNQSIVLTAAHEFWQGSQEFNLNNILDGVKLDFPTYESTQSTAKTPSYRSQESVASLDSDYLSQKKRSNKWIWMGSAVAASLITGFILANSNGSAVSAVESTRISPQSTPTIPAPSPSPSPKPSAPRTPGRGRSS